MLPGSKNPSGRVPSFHFELTYLQRPFRTRELLRQLSDRWNRPGGIPPCDREVVGVAALRGEQGDPMGKPYAIIAGTERAEEFRGDWGQSRVMDIGCCCVALPFLVHHVR